MITQTNAGVKRGLSLYLPDDLHSRAVALRINMSQAARDGIRSAVEAEEKARSIPLKRRPDKTTPGSDHHAS